MNYNEYRNLSDEQKFKATEYFIEASYEETLGIWKQFVDSPYENCRPLNWEQLDGTMCTVATVSIQYDDKPGEIKRMPICVSIMWNLVDGHLMAFYEACSLVVDHDVVQKFIDDKHPNKHIRTNASNFHQALHHCNIDINKKLTE
jgi:hypothetical protein